MRPLCSFIVALVAFAVLAVVAATGVAGEINGRRRAI